MSEKESTNPLTGASRPVNPNSGDKEFYQEEENSAGFVRHHLVDDKWFKCGGTDPSCSICLSDAHLQEVAEGLVGQVLTVIDTLNLSDRQFKAVKDLIKNIIYTEQDSLELEMRRIIVNGVVPKEKA